MSWPSLQSVVLIIMRMHACQTATYIETMERTIAQNFRHRRVTKTRLSNNLQNTICAKTNIIIRVFNVLLSCKDCKGFRNDPNITAVIFFSKFGKNQKKSASKTSKYLIKGN